MQYFSPRVRLTRGFTLIELLTVVFLIALGSAAASLAMRDPAATRLEREASRLVALLEAARAESRASGLTVTWIPLKSRANDNAAEAPPDHKDFQFVGLPSSSQLPTHWLGPDVTVEVWGAKGVVLGPEPLIGSQRITLRLEKQELTLRTDGLGAFAVAAVVIDDQAPGLPAR